jgi:hypothetical protein
LILFIDHPNVQLVGASKLLPDFYLHIHSLFFPFQLSLLSHSIRRTAQNTTMRVRKSTTSILLLLAGSLAVQAANIPVPAIHPAANKDVVATTTTTGVAEVHTKAPHPDKVNKEPGSVDAPVDGLDGKPHTGPGLFETKGKGTGSVGISSGNLHVDLKKPPPHTGDHEIVGLEEKEGDDKVRAETSIFA